MNPAPPVTSTRSPMSGPPSKGGERDALAEVPDQPRGGRLTAIDGVDQLGQLDGALDLRVESPIAGKTARPRAERAAAPLLGPLGDGLRRRAAVELGAKRVEGAVDVAQADSTFRAPEGDLDLAVAAGVEPPRAGDLRAGAAGEIQEGEGEILGHVV